MNPEDIPIRQKIILATIECINQMGIQEITTRKIAAQANVNSAAINYYFGSKDRLVELALEFTIKNTFSEMVDEHLAIEGKNPHEAIRGLFLEIFAGALNFPGILRAHLQKPFLFNNYDNVFIKYYDTFLARLLEKLKELAPETDEVELRTSLSQICSVILFSGALPLLHQTFSQLDFNREEDRERYIDFLLESYFPSIK